MTVPPPDPTAVPPAARRRPTRRGLVASLAALPLLGACAGLLPGRGSAYYDGPATDHFDGRRFFNPGGEAPRSFVQLLQWQLGETAEAWPDAVPSPFPPDRPPARVDGGAVRVSVVGHCTFLIQGGGLNLLTDPVWSERASPFSFTGPRRYNPPAIAFDDLPPIDAVLLSHAHYDHLDVATLERLWRRDRPLVVTPLGNDAIVRANHPDERIVAADWGDTVPLGRGATATLEPVHHWSARGVTDRNHALWAGFVVKGLGLDLFFAGDTGFDGGRPFRNVAARHGPLDLALLPIGAYEPRWFMAAQHMNPEDAVAGFGLLGARNALGYHWGTFRLTNEGAERPVTALAAALEAAGTDPARFLAVRPGQVWTGGAGVG
ncbi:MAG: MBL fold metallo-hydrolase [Rhodospirillales bacterium]